MEQLALDKIILAYLHQRGYKNAEKALSSDLGSTKIQDFLKEMNTVKENNAIVDNVLFYGLSQTSAETFVQQYRKMLAWVHASLPPVKEQLFPVLFPIFAHIYLSLISRSNIKVASMFLSEHKGPFEQRYNTELGHLNTITLPSHVEENDYSLTLQHAPYPLSMHETVYTMFLTYLCDQKMAIIICILNTYIKITPTVDPLPLNAAQKKSGSAADPSIATNGQLSSQQHQAVPLHRDDQIHQINSKGVLWGVPNSEATDVLKSARLRAIKASGPASSSDRSLTDPGYEADAQESTHGRSHDNGSHVPSHRRVPIFSAFIPEVDPLYQDDIKNRVFLKDPSYLPSVCMYTFYNISQGLSCLKFSIDSFYAAAGLESSVIKLYSLTNDPLIPLKPLAEPSRKAIEAGELYDLTARDKEKTLVGHSGPVYAIDFSPDNKFMISCSADATARLWNMDTFTNTVIYKGHDYPVWDVAFSPFGYYFATCSYDKTARLWCTAQIYPLRIFVGHLGSVATLCFHPNGNYLFTGSSDKTVRMWDVQNGECVRILMGYHRAEITKLIVSRDGKYLISGASDGSLLMWDISTSRKITAFVGHTDAIYSLSFCYDGNVFASGSADNTVRIWDITRPKKGNDLYLEASLILPTLHTAPIELSFSRRNILLAGGSHSPESV